MLSPILTRRRFVALTTTAVLGLAVFGSASAAPTPEAVFADPDIPALGNPEGDVTIVEFFDYQCPFCKTNYPILKALVAEDTGIRLVMKDWPIFGDASLHASRLVLGAVGTPMQAVAHDALMGTPARLSIEDVERTLLAAGLDPQEMLSGYKAKSQHVDAILQRNGDQALGFSLSGTPAFVIGRRVYGGALDRKGLEQAVAEARAGAKP